jgi:hypothetical protein
MTDEISLRVRHGVGTNYRTMALDPAQTARFAVDRIASNFGIAHADEYTVYIPPRDEKTKGSLGFHLHFVCLFTLLPCF